MRIVIWVEGDSDKAVLDELLRGVRSDWERRQVRLRINVSKGPVTGRIGKYAPRDFADGAAYVFALADVHSEDRDAEDVRTRLREAVHAVVQDSGLRERFRPHVAVPEMEAWLLADEAALPQGKAGSPHLRANPEALAPGKAKQLLDQFLQSARDLRHGYNGTADARAIASRTNPDVVAQKCNHFRELLGDLMRCTGIGEAES